MEQQWWNAQAIFNKLRLRTIRKRGLHFIHEKLGQPEFQQLLIGALQAANRCANREEAIAYMSRWLQQQSMQSGQRVLGQLWDDLQPLLSETEEQRSYASGQFSAARSSASMTGLPQHPAPRSSASLDSLPKVPRPSVSSDNLSRVPRSSANLDSVPRSSPPSAPRREHSSYLATEQPSRVRHPLPPRRISESSVTLPSIPDQRDSQAETSATPRSTPPQSQDSTLISRMTRQDSRDRLRHLRREQPRFDRESREQALPSEKIRSHAELDAVAPPSASTTDPAPKQARSRRSGSNPVPAQISSTKPKESPTEMETRHPSTSSGFWLPSTTMEKESSSDNLDDLVFSSWWDTNSVLDSLRFRLERRRDATQLNLLINHDEFLQIIRQGLEEAAVLKTIHDAQRHIRERILKLQELTPENNWSDAFWHVLRPLLQLRHRYSGSFDAMPEATVRQIERARANRESHDDLPAPPQASLYDWENDNREWIRYINGVVGKIAHVKEDE